MSGEVEQQQAVNGVHEDDGVLLSEEELEKGKMRPPDIDQDMKVGALIGVLCYGNWE